MTFKDKKLLSNDLRSELIPQMMATLIEDDINADPCNGCQEKNKDFDKHKCQDKIDMDGESVPKIFLASAKRVLEADEPIEQPFKDICVILGHPQEQPLNRQHHENIFTSVKRLTFGEQDKPVFRNLSSTLVRVLVNEAKKKKNK